MRAPVKRPATPSPGNGLLGRAALMVALLAGYWLAFPMLHGRLGNPAFLLGMVLCLAGGALLGPVGAILVVLTTVALDRAAAMSMALDREIGFSALAVAVLIKLTLGVGTGITIDSRRRLRAANQRLAEEVTARRRNEAALVRSQTLQRALVESLGEGVGVFDANDRFRFANRALAESLGSTTEDLLGQWFPELLTEQSQIALARVRSGPGTGPRTYEVVPRGSDPTPLLVTETVFERSDWEDALTLRVLRRAPARS